MTTPRCRHSSPEFHEFSARRLGKLETEQGSLVLSALARLNVDPW